jgi:hypothetical protein
MFSASLTFIPWMPKTLPTPPLLVMMTKYISRPFQISQYGKREAKVTPGGEPGH